MNILFTMLQAQQGAPQGGFNGLLMIVLLFVVMWLLMIRPQRKKAKEEQQMREQLKKGDRVLFSGGIYGSHIDPVPIIHFLLFRINAFLSNSGAFCLTSMSSKGCVN